MCDYAQIIRERNPIFGFEQTAGIKRCVGKFYRVIKVKCTYCSSATINPRTCLLHHTKEVLTRNEMWSVECDCTSISTNNTGIKITVPSY